MKKLSWHHGCQVTVGSPARRSLKWRQGYPAGFQRSCVKVDVDAGCYKPLNWNFWRKLRLSVGCTGKIEFVVNWNETAVYVLGFCVGFVAARSFCAGIFLLRSGVRKWSVQPWAFPMYFENLEIDNSPKCGLSIKGSGQITSNTLWK